jgi:hypothetical protein
MPGQRKPIRIKEDGDAGKASVAKCTHKKENACQDGVPRKDHSTPEAGQDESTSRLVKQR